MDIKVETNANRQKAKNKRATLFMRPPRKAYGKNHVITNTSINKPEGAATVSEPTRRTINGMEETGRIRITPAHNPY